MKRFFIETKAPQTAVIYCRMAGGNRAPLTDLLTDQEERCRSYAISKQLEVATVFYDMACGRSTKRPGFEAMVSYLKHHSSVPHAVIVDDPTRLARDMAAFVRLQSDIQSAGAVLWSITNV